VPEPIAFEVEMAIEKLKRYKSPGIDQIPAELIKAGCSKICKISSIWNKDELPEQWKESIIVPVYKKSDKTSYNNYRSIPRLSNKYKNLSNILLRKLLGIVIVGFDVTGRLLIIYFAFIKYLRKNGNTMRQCISYL
jgi:hypothetical protein